MSYAEFSATHLGAIVPEVALAAGLGAAAIAGIVIAAVAGMFIYICMCC